MSLAESILSKEVFEVHSGAALVKFLAEDVFFTLRRLREGKNPLTRVEPRINFVSNNEMKFFFCKEVNKCRL